MAAAIISVAWRRHNDGKPTAAAARGGGALSKNNQRA